MDKLQILARLSAQALLLAEQQLRIQCDRGNCVVDVVSDPARHLSEHAQALLLHDTLLGATQILIRGLQRRVKLGVLRSQCRVLGHLAQELTFPAAESPSRVPRRDKHAENLALEGEGAMTSDRIP